jgi:hypothetical protein
MYNHTVCGFGSVEASYDLFGGSLAGANFFQQKSISDW